MTDTTQQPLYPEVTVELSGVDGNAMSIIAAVTRALRRAGHGSQISEFTKEAMSGDYDNVIRTAMRWVSVQ